MAITRYELIGLYVANFNRVPDLAGYEYWMRQGELGSSFSDISTSFQAILQVGTTYSVDEYIDLLYVNLFNRASDASGKAYWQAQLAGTLSLANLPLVMINSANNIVGTTADDWGTVNNKIITASAFLDTKNTSVTVSLSTITHDPTSATTLVTEAVTTSAPSVKGGLDSCTYTLPSSSTSIPSDMKMDVIGKFKELTEVALSSESIYMRAKDTFKELFDDTKLTNSEYAQAASAFISQLAVSTTNQAMEAAIKWADAENKHVYEVETLKANAELAMAQREKIGLEMCKLEKDVALQCANITATLATSIRKNGGVSKYDTDGCSPLELKNEGTDYTQQLLLEANRYQTLADSYRKSGTVTLGTTADGINKGIAGDADGYTDAQEAFARRQILSFEDSKRSHAANAISQMIGQLLASEAVIDPQYAQQWSETITYLNTNTPSA